MTDTMQRLFGFDASKNSVRTEIIAGLTTFLTMSYVLAVNPSILSDAGMDRGALFTVTILSSALATLVMAFYAKLPFALAPAMGLNAFFAYTVCGLMGYTWQFALTAVLIEGILFIILTLTGLRTKLVNALPLSVRNAIAPGIGLFITLLGLKSAGVVVENPSTLVAMGSFGDPSVLLTFFGLLVTVVMLVRKVPGAFLLGIIITTVAGIPLGLTKWQGFLDTPPSIAPVFMKFDMSNVFSIDMLVIVFTFLFIDLFDTVGSLVGASVPLRRADGTVHNMNRAFMADAIGTTAGAMLGTSTVSTYVESVSGINSGGRTGLTAFVTAVCLLLSLFMAPFFLSVPSAATAPVLIIVGLMMARSLKDVDLTDYADAIPAFICLVMMPFSYSISDGIAMGVMSYVLINACSGRFSRLRPASYVLFAFFLLKYIAAVMKF